MLDNIQSMLGSSFRTGYGVYAIDKLLMIGPHKDD